MDSPASPNIGVLAGRLRSLRRSGEGGEGADSRESSAGRGGGGGRSTAASAADDLPGISIGTDGSEGKDKMSARLLFEREPGAGLGPEGDACRGLLEPVTTGRSVSPNCLPKLSSEGKARSNLSSSSTGDAPVDGGVAPWVDGSVGIDFVGLPRVGLTSPPRLPPPSSCERAERALRADPPVTLGATPFE